MTEVDIIIARKNFDIEIKERFSSGITGIYGPSGSGKTSLLLAISGLLKPRKGSISIGHKMLYNSEEGANIAVKNRNIGYVFQEGRLFPHMSVEKNLRYGNKPHISNKVTFDEVVDLLDLQHILSSKPAQISGGERQRTALGRSLLSSPEILLLDEPFSAVDTQLRSQILPFIISIQKKVEIPILVVSHDLTDLLKLSRTLFVMEEGKCVGHGDYYDLLKEDAISKIFGKGSLVNAIDMKIVKINPDKGLAHLQWNDHANQVQVRCDKIIDQCDIGQPLKVFIHADDIALSTEKLSNVTIQNQIKGTISDVVQRGASVLCIVDAGFKLVVEITVESQKRMNLDQGSEIWCLFKSVAIDVAAV